VLVGDVVADEHGGASTERRLAHELQHRRTLVAAGRLHLDHALAGLDAEVRAQARRERAHETMRVATEPRRASIVERERGSLVLEHESRARRDLGRDALAHTFEARRGERVVRDVASGIPALHAVLAGRGEARAVGAEQAVDVGERAPAHHRHRAAVVRRVPRAASRSRPSS
jgi:hypothetical protein